MATPLPEERPTLTLVPPPAETPVFKDEPATRSWVESARTVAGHTNKVARLALLPHTVRGYRQLGRRWVERYRDDYPQMIASTDRAIREADGDVVLEGQLKQRRAELRAEYRRHRKGFAGKSAGVAAAVTGGGMFGLATGSLWLDLAAGLGAWGLGAFHGRDRSEPSVDTVIGLPADDTVRSPGSVTLDDLPAGGKPFPIRRAETPQQASICVLLAMVAENVPVVEVWDVERQPWGWQCKVRVDEGTPEAIIAKAGGLETKFDLPTNGVRPQPMVERRACAILRLVEGNPFATAPGLPYRAPKSISITEKSRIGTSVGGESLDAALAGVMGLVVAASGGGKTGLLQALGEITTACYDNITIDLDPHGDGLEDLHDAVRVTGRSHEQIEAALLFFLMLSKGRARLRAKLGMGKKWQVSKKHPHFTVIFDEFPKGSELAKRLAFDLLLVGRKEAVTLIIASQGGTKLYLGENIAQMIALKAVGPCKVGDTRAVFGDGAVGEGWMPHKLSPATDTDPKDAGHVYLQGVPGRPDEPIEYAVHETPSDTLRKLAAERLEAGLVEPDQASLDAMRSVDLPEYVEPEYDKDGDLKKPAPVELLTWEQLLRLCEAEPPAGVAASPAVTLHADAVDLMDKAGLDRMRPETLRDALAGHDPDRYGALTVDALKDLLEDTVGKPVPLGPVDGLTNPRGFKRAALEHFI
jgi:S-DNA-T family DNA segregation ATPase FtsK/SpoIIIE